jgi:hypothetical protein
LRNDAAGIQFADASPQKRLARPPGADRGGVGAFCVSVLSVCHNPRMKNTQSSPHLRLSRAVRFDDAPYD